MRRISLFISCCILLSTPLSARLTGTWNSPATGTVISYTSTESESGLTILSSSNNKLTIRLQLDQPYVCTLQIFDQGGKEIFISSEFIAVPGTFEKEISNLPTQPIYLIQISTSRKRAIQKNTTHN